jgi:hypothetical protein
MFVWGLNYELHHLLPFRAGLSGLACLTLGDLPDD